MRRPSSIVGNQRTLPHTCGPGAHWTGLNWGGDRRGDAAAAEDAASAQYGSVVLAAEERETSMARLPRPARLRLSG